MCGRFTLHTDLEQIQQVFKIDETAAEPQPSYNIAPTQPVLSVLRRDGKTTLVEMRWGLIPFWAKDPSIGSRMINARAESLSAKTSFKRPFKSQRCLIVSDGFYEWRKDGTQKVPMFIHLKSGEPFGFAGLYDTWKSPEGEVWTTCTIITGEPNALVKPIHDRMPVIIPGKQQAAWLDPANQDTAKLSKLLVPYPAGEMQAYPVSRLVNSVQNNSPQLIEPLAA